MKEDHIKGYMEEARKVDAVVEAASEEEAELTEETKEEGMEPENKTGNETVATGAGRETEATEATDMATMELKTGRRWWPWYRRHSGRGGWRRKPPGGRWY